MEAHPDSKTGCGVRDYFHACVECEALMCCSGRDCGCYGMPTDFKHTDKCGDDCELKKYAEENNG